MPFHWQMSTTPHITHMISTIGNPILSNRLLHLPVFDTVLQVTEAVGEVPNGSVVTVPPAFTKDAVMEAIEAGIELVVIVTERIPRRDVAEMVELAGMRGARIIGPNCLGVTAQRVA
jgi:succinyl-CoA synthetase alpha subunit